MKPPENTKYLLFGGTFVLANKLQFVGDKVVDGLSTKQWFLLRNMMDMPREPAPTITQIARAMDSTRQNIAKMLEVMKRQGYVVLTRDETDHRNRCVRITASGLTCAEQTASNAKEFLERLYEGISSEERETAGCVMKKMVENLQRMQEEKEKGNV